MTFLIQFMQTATFDVGGEASLAAEQETVRIYVTLYYIRHPTPTNPFPKF
jgi:hypothetical protein